MCLCALMLLLLATALYKAASEITACSLPFSKLYIVIDSTLVSCVVSESSTFSARCRTACSCRRLEIERSTYGVCLNSSATFNCDAAENAIRCTQEERTSAAIFAVELASNSNSNKVDLKPWQWALIGLAIVLVVGLLLFIINFVKNRPLRGDNRREVAQTLDVSRPEPKDDVNLLPIVPCKSEARTATSNRASITRSHDTNPTQVSDFSGGSYRTYAGNQMSSTLTDTKIVTQHWERAFSPISASSHSARSSDYFQGVETSTMSVSPSKPDRHPYPSRTNHSLSSDNDSFSSQLTLDDFDTETGGRVPPRKSIEF